MDPQDYLPSSPEAEKGILCSIMHAPEKVLGACQVKNVSEDWFYLPDHGQTFLMLSQMHKEGVPIELPAICQYYADIRKDFHMDAPAPEALFADLFSFVPTGVNWAYYLGILQEKAAQRHGIIACDATKAALRESNGLQAIYDVTTGAFQKVHDLCVSEDHEDYDQKTMMAFLDHMNAAADGTYKPEFFKTTFPMIDDECGGLSRGELLLIRGKRGCGKSLVSQAIAQHNALSEKKASVALFTFEMPYFQYLRRIVASAGRVSLKSMREMRYTQAEMTGFSRAMAQTSLSKLRIYDIQRIKKPTPASIFSHVRRHAKNYGIDIVVVDHLNLVQLSDKKEKRTDEMLHDFSAQFKAMCLELNMVGILLAQENSEGGTFGSTQVEADADNCMTLIPVHKRINGINRIVGTSGAFLDKWREGNLLGRTIPLTMDGGYATIYQTPVGAE